MQLSKEHYKLGVVVFFCVLFMIGAWYQRQKEEALLKLEQRYVVADVIERRTPRGNPIVVYTYSYKHKKYKLERSIPTFKVKKGERYLVTLPKGHEDKGFILYEDPPVPDGVESPPNGWDKKPNFVDR